MVLGGAYLLLQAFISFIFMMDLLFANIEHSPLVRQIIVHCLNMLSLEHPVSNVSVYPLAI